MSQIQKINQYHMAGFAHMLSKMNAIKEGDGTLLDNCMIVYGSGLSNGNRHTHYDLPILMAGRGGNTIKTGRHLVFPRNTPMNDLFLSMLDRVGAKYDSIGDSKGRLKGLEG